MLIKITVLEEILTSHVTNSKRIASVEKDQQCRVNGGLEDNIILYSVRKERTILQYLDYHNNNTKA